MKNKYNTFEDPDDYPDDDLKDYNISDYEENQILFKAKIQKELALIQSRRGKDYFDQIPSPETLPYEPNWAIRRLTDIFVPNTQEESQITKVVALFNSTKSEETEIESMNKLVDRLLELFYEMYERFNLIMIQELIDLQQAGNQGANSFNFVGFGKSDTLIELGSVKIRNFLTTKNWKDWEIDLADMFWRRLINLIVILHPNLS